MTDQCDVLSDLHLNDTDESVNEHKNVQAKLNEIRSDYESIFSWDIYNKVGENGDILSNFIEKITEKYEIYNINKNDFNLYRFYYKLIISFEYYNSANYEESLREAEDIVQFLDSCTFDDYYKPYTKSFNHIARSTYVYIALSMNVDPKKIVGNITLKGDFSRDEKAAICAIKAFVFKEYSPTGNDIALDYSNQACSLCPTEPEWINVWLIAKGRVRRYNQDVQSYPDKSEIVAAEKLLNVKNQKSDFLMQAFHVYLAGNQFGRAAELISKAIILAKNDIPLLFYCFMSYIFLPKRFRLQTQIDDMIEKLQNLDYYFVNLALGQYYFKVEKDYKKAKTYFSRGAVSGTFSSFIWLLRTECNLQPLDTFPYIQTLNMIYDGFVTPKRRLFILAQILNYYCYFDNPKELMRYLKLYMDQDISDEQKTLELSVSIPYFSPSLPVIKRGTYLLGILTTYVENISNYNCWDTEEKKIVMDTLNRFNKMRQVVTTKNSFCENNKPNWRLKKYQKHEKDDKSNWFEKHNRPLTKQLQPTIETNFHDDRKKNDRENSWRKNQNYRSDKELRWFKIKQYSPSTSQTEPTDEIITQKPNIFSNRSSGNPF